MPRPRVILAGCGFLGEAAAGLFFGQGWSVLGLTASEDSATRLQSGGRMEARAVDITRPFDAMTGWAGADVVIHCASSGRGGAAEYDAVYRRGIENLLAAFTPDRVIFTGSSSVYSQTDGSVVDEESPAVPSGELASILLEAERIALNHAGVVARLSGLYGPGRSVLLRKYLNGSAMLEEGGGRWINQIHRDDAAAALFHLATHRAACGIYNVCDDTPATQRDVYGWIAEALGGALPPDGPRNTHRKRGWTSKRISNARLRATGWSPVFPCYRDALPSLLAQESTTQAR